MCRVLFRDVDSLPVDLNTIYYYLAYVAWRYVGDEDRRARGCWIILSSPPLDMLQVIFPVAISKRFNVSRCLPLCHI